MLDQSVSKVEVRGLTARFYDQILNWGSLGKYGRFLKSAIALLDIQPRDAILDLGCGTGKNDCLMAEYLNLEGRIVGVDIGQEMAEQFEKNCGKFKNIRLHQQSILEPLPFENEFDKVFMSFVFHGFTQENRKKIIDNAYRVLKADGQLIVLDFNEFEFAKKPLWFRVGFKAIECPLAFEYIKINWKEQLKTWGFEMFEEHLWFMDTLRLFKAKKFS
ncbi:MAG: class I SAM-dependent methyltransferase [Caldisericaceae bacterium]|nr:class I SAM-dependent methyltransferase [Caldisericaceae bacterium]